jgi:hypothetical protein
MDRLRITPILLLALALTLAGCRSAATDDDKAAELLRFRQRNPQVVAGYPLGLARSEVMQRFDPAAAKQGRRFVRTLRPGERVNADVEWSWEWVSAELAERETGRRVARVDTLEDTTGSRTDSIYVCYDGHDRVLRAYARRW